MNNSAPTGSIAQQILTCYGKFWGAFNDNLVSDRTFKTMNAHLSWSLLQNRGVSNALRLTVWKRNNETNKL